MSALASIHSAILESSQLLHQLNALLLEERTAMENNEHAAMQGILPEKTNLLEQLQSSAQKRAEYLQDRGFTPDEAGLLDFLNSSPTPQAQPVLADWNKLKSDLQHCQSDNAINGKIVHRSKQQLDALLNILRGQGDQAKVYTDAGTERSVNQNQPLAKA